MALSERLKRARKENGITQKTLAERLKVSPQMVSKYESGKINPTVDTLQRIADALDVPVEELIGTTPQPDREWEEISGILEDAGMIIEEAGRGDGPDENGDHLYIWHKDAEDIYGDRIEITYGELRRIMAEIKRGAELKARDYIHKRLEAELF